MTVKIGTVNIPSTMSARALEYRFEPGQAVARNGLGEIQVAGGAIVTWTWAVLDAAEYAWWVTTLLAGAASKTFTGTAGSTVLYNDLQAEQAFYSCCVLRPQYESYRGSYYNKVTVIIDCLL